MNDKQLIEKIRYLGINEYNASCLLKCARRNGWSLQRTYIFQHSRLIFVYLFMAIFTIGFVSYIAVDDIEGAIIALFTFSLLFSVVEFATRFHKGFLKKIGIFFKLGHLPLPKKHNSGPQA